MAFFSPHLGMIGIDVSDQSIECAQLHAASARGSAVIHGLSRIALPAGTIVDGKLQHIEHFQYALRQALLKPLRGALDSREVVLAIPEHQCYHHVFSLPETGSQRLPYTVIQDRLAASMPLPMEELCWDWTMVPQKGSQPMVYAVAMPKAVIEAYRQSLLAVGLLLRMAEPQIVSAGRGLWKATTNQPFIFVDMGSTETAVSTIDGHGIHQSSVVPFGVQAIINEFMQSLNINRQTAEQILFTIGLRQLRHPQIEAIHEVIVRHVRLLYQEMGQHALYYSTREAGQQPLARFRAVGGGSLIPGLIEALSHLLRMEYVSVPGSDRYRPIMPPKEYAIFANALGAARRQATDHDQVNVLVTRRRLPKTRPWWQLYRD